jgi:hypothetical protein
VSDTGSHYIVHAGLELETFLPLPSEKIAAMFHHTGKT